MSARIIGTKKINSVEASKSRAYSIPECDYVVIFGVTEGCSNGEIIPVAKSVCYKGGDAYIPVATYVTGSITTDINYSPSYVEVSID